MVIRKLGGGIEYKGAKKEIWGLWTYSDWFYGEYITTHLSIEQYTTKSDFYYGKIINVMWWTLDAIQAVINESNYIINMIFNCTKVEKGGKELI